VVHFDDDGELLPDGQVVVDRRWAMSLSASSS
jgi:hypothetical protein